ncbi:MAG: DUF4239 domain-containing protein [Holophaga sp.]|nr:DUF4239 domain-containing protein [Holophaga sp.]
MPFAARLCLLNFWVAYLVISGVFLAYSLLGLCVRHRWLPHARLRTIREPAGIVFNVIAVLYAVLLAFMVISVWEGFNQASLTVEAESGSLLAIVMELDAHRGHSAAFGRLKQAVDGYAHSVMEEEYPAMGRMQRSPRTTAAFERIWAAAHYLGTDSPGEINLQQSIYYHLGEAQKARESRLLLSRRGLPAAMWTVILAGAFLTMTFSLFISTERFWPQALMNFSLGLITALVIFAILELSYPFVGNVNVAPEGFEYLIQNSR